MKLKEYMKELKELVKKHPELANAELVTSSDDEGNDFIPVIYGPSAGIYKDGEWNDITWKPTHICLN